jgi:acetyl esterase/lipase
VLLIPLLLLLCLCAGPGGQASASESRRPPLLYVLPPGAFAFPVDRELMKEARQSARGHGFQVREIDYPLRNPMRAWRVVRDDARRAARNGRYVFAYGESAGGVLASLLAQKGIAEAAVSNAGPSNLSRLWDAAGWRESFGTDPRHRSFLSPALHSTENPILVQQSMTDEIVPGDINSRWAKRDPRVRFDGYTGPHIYGHNYGMNLRTALGFLRARR